jgi:hypothetical protein
MLLDRDHDAVLVAAMHGRVSVGLDLVVEACAKPGHEAEWRQILERSFGTDEPQDGDVSRFAEISIPPHERVGAPRVGYDSVADNWIIEASKASTPQEVSSVLKECHGYYVLRLVESDGVPEYSHGGLYEGVDETSFRGSFLSGCNDVLEKELIEEAWGHKFPEEAIGYGQKLLATASAAAAVGPSRKQPSRRGLLSRLRRAENTPESEPFEEQLKIAQAAGRWFIFWGERGHAIRAWF